METEKKKNPGLGYLLALAGRRKTAVIGAAGCSVLIYGLIAAGAIVLRVGFHALSMAQGHVGAYHTLYEVRLQICGHLGKVHLGFFTDNSTGEVKKVLMEDVDRLEQFLAHHLPDIVTAIVVPVVVLGYLFTVNVWMSLALLATMLVIILLMGVELSVSKKRMDAFYQM